MPESNPLPTKYIYNFSYLYIYLCVSPANLLSAEILSKL